MKFWDLIRIANRNLFRNKLRTFLTVAAIFVGSFTLTMTNGLGDGMRSYVESQVKNIESDRVIMVRRKIERPAGGPKAGAPEEYKEMAKDDEGEVFDPNTFLLSIPQMEAAIRDLDGVKGITPRYQIKGEYITLDGQKSALRRHHPKDRSRTFDQRNGSDSDPARTCSRNGI
jgi:putative ABC transport system permease protein